MAFQREFVLDFAYKKGMKFVYLICDYKGTIAEICEQPAYIKRQSNGVDVLCLKSEATAIYSNDTDSFYPAQKAATPGNAYNLVEVEEIPHGVTALTWKYQNGEFTLVGKDERLGPEMQTEQNAQLLNTLLGVTP